MGVYGLIVRNRRAARRAAVREGLRCADLARLQGCNVDRAAWDDAVAFCEPMSVHRRRDRDETNAYFARVMDPDYRFTGTADVHSVRADVLEAEAALYGAWNGGAQ